MQLEEKVNNQIKEAMKAKNASALRGLRAIKSELLLLKTETKDKKVTSEDELKLLQRLVKQRKESIETYSEQGREDLVKTEQEELDLIESFLPKQMSPEEIEQVIEKIVNDTQAQSMADMGKVMSVAMKELLGKAEGKTISSIVKSKLANK